MMPKTPVTSETSSTRFNPYIGKSISKTLLTPCRQIGLSRKRKTPNSLIKSQSFNESLNLSISPLTSHQTSIVHPTTDSVEPKTATTKSTNEDKGKSRKESGRKVVRCLTMDDNTREELNSGGISSLDINDCKSPKIKTKNTRCDQKEALIKRGSGNKEVVKNKSNCHREQSPIKDGFKGFDIEPKTPLDAKQRFSQEECQTKKKIKNFRRSLSTRKVQDDYEETESNKPNDIRDCSIVLSPLEISHTVEEKSSDKCKDEDFVLSGFEPNKLAALEEQVKEKRKILEDLKQAEIYKKLHNVSALKQLTGVWKKGCISAMNDLLIQLRTHADIDMETLLNNLRVPKDLIMLSSDGELC